MQGDNAGDNVAQPSIALALAEFAKGLELDAVPKSVVEKAKHLLLDSLGAAFASANFDFGRDAVNGLSAVGSGSSIIIGFKERLSLRDAAIVNGILVHGLDYDDAAIIGRVHPSSTCMPVAIGMAAQVGASGAALLASYIAALECTIRLGAVVKGGFQKRGFHPTGVVNTFGAAIAAGKLLSLPAQQLAMAQGIALSMAGGSQEFAEEGAWTKRIHPGWAAASGMTAAALAKGGYTGPTKAYEGGRGLYRLFLGELFEQCDLSLATRDLGEEWLIEAVSVKPTPACYFNVPIIDAATRIATEHNLHGEDIARVRALVPEAAVNLVCEPVGRKRRPRDSYAAQFSVQFTAAVALMRRRFGLDDLDDATLQDPAILALADRVDYELDPKTTFPAYYAGAVEVTTRDGRVLTVREDVHRGAPERPLSEAEFVAKVVGSAERLMPSSQVRAIVDGVLGIERLDDARVLVGKLARP